MTYHYGNDIPGFFFDIMNQPIFSGGKPLYEPRRIIPGDPKFSGGLPGLVNV